MYSYAQRKHRSLRVIRRGEREKMKVRKRVREALFSVVKGRTCLCRVFGRTGGVLICPGRGREEWLNGGREEKQCKGRWEEWKVPPLRKGGGGVRN